MVPILRPPGQMPCLVSARSSIKVAALALLLLALPGPARPQIVETRADTANPMISVFQSTLYGGAAGGLLGLAVDLVDSDDDHDEIKWGVVAGTFFGFAYGFYYVAVRPSPGHALLEAVPGGVSAGWPHLSFGVRKSDPGSPAPPTRDVKAHLFLWRF